MTEKTVYIPYNGNNIFYDKDDCLTYEWETEILPAIKDSIAFFGYDNNDDTATKYELIDNSGYTDFNAVYCNSDYMEIYKPIDPDISMVIKNDYDIEIPTDTGLYEYEYEWDGDDYICHWYKIDEDD